MKKIFLLFFMMVFAFMVNINASSFGRNILTNGSFENDFRESGWNAWGGQWEIVSKDALDGNKMLKITTDPESKDPWNTQVKVEPFDAKIGNQYEISFYIKSDVPGEVRLSFNGMSNSWPWIEGRGSIATSTTWRKVIYSPETIGDDWYFYEGTLQIYIDLGYIPNVTYCIDDVRVIDYTTTTNAVVDGICYNLAGSQAEVVSNGGLYTGDVIIPDIIAYDDIYYYVTKIGDSAFDGCGNLTSITFPESVTSIKSNAFVDCNSLTSIVNLAPIPALTNYSAFSGIDKNTCILYVPFGSGEAYRAERNWEDFKNIIELPNLSKEEIDITPSENNVLIEWQAYENAEGYKLIIYSNETHTDTVCVLTFDAEGKWLRSANSTISQTIENLSKGTDYYYTIEILGVNNAILASLSGEFTTAGEQTFVVETKCVPNEIVGYYNIMGIKLPKEPESGLYIILYSDGKSMKMIKK